MATFKEQSKDRWHATNRQPYTEELKFGALQRIADAAELMAQNHAALIEERDRYKRWYEEERKRSQKLRNRVAGLQGAFKRFRK